MPAPPAPDSPSRATLVARLVALRASTGLSGNAFAKRMGVVQSRVWKIEHRELFPTEEDIRMWVAAAEQPEEVAGELIDLLGKSHSEHETWRAAYSRAGGAGALQREYREEEEQSTLIGEFQIAYIPGILQTRQYARETLTMPCGPLAWDASEHDIETMLAERMHRTEIIFDPAKRVQIVLGEAALRTLVVSPQTMIEQLHKLEMVAAVPTIELGIIGFHQRMPVYPFTAFGIRDNEVYVEHFTDEVNIKPDQIADWVHFFNLLRDAASTGPAAIEIIERALRDLQAGE